MIVVYHQYFLIMGACNLKCKYCFYETGMLNYAGTRIKPADVHRWLAHYTNESILKSVTFTGGEPLLRRDIIDFIEVSQVYTDDVGIITNGTLITQDLAEIFRDKNIEVHVSLDSITSDYHERTRGLMKETLKGLETLASSNVKRKSITCVLSSENIDQVIDLIDFATNLGFSINFSPISVDKENKLSLSKISKEAKLTLMQNLNEWAKKNNKEYYLGLISFILKGFNVPKLSNCTFTNNSIVIDSDGSIYPCYQHKESKQYKLGNIKESKISEVREKREIFMKLTKPASCIKEGCLGVF